MKEIIDAVKKVTGYDVTENTRKREVVETRAMYYNILRTVYPKISLFNIGKSVNRNHATVIHSLKYYNIFEKYNPLLKKQKDKVLSILNTENEIEQNNHEEQIRLLKIQISLLEEKNRELMQNNYNLCQI